MGRPAEDLTGKKFNKLTVIRRATEKEWPRGAGRHAKWLCKCDCGNLTFVQSSDLKNGGTKSCGCVAKESAAKLAYKLGKENFQDLTGKKFGKLTVIKQGPYYQKQIQWECKCDCGATTLVRAYYLLNGHTTSCGCNRHWGNGQTSKGEEKIISLLKEANIPFEREKTLPDMKKHGNHLRFDFYLPDKKIALEFNGAAHYQQIDFFHKNKQEFQKRQEYDRYKIGYCLSHGITIYCIPYWELDNLHTAADLFNPRFRARSHWKNDQDWQQQQNLTKRR